MVKYIYDSLKLHLTRMKASQLLVIVFLVFVIFFLLPQSNVKEGNYQNIIGTIHMMTEQNYADGRISLKIVLNEKRFPSIVRTEDNGRLGNQISAYASLLYFQKQHGMQAILEDWQISSLAKVFQKEKLQIPASRIEMPPQLRLNWEAVATQTPQGTYFPNEQFLKNINEYKYNKFINIGVYPNYLFLYKEILPYLREHLVFRADIRSLVDQLMEQIQKKDNSGKNILFIGVHCRRTDFAIHMMRASNASLINHQYFDRAFQIYRSRYNTPSTRVIFLAVSDDNFWIKENLSKHNDVLFGHYFSQGKVKDADMPTFDLCLLAACNHSIHTYGTYGQWGSLLAGGDVIAVTGTNKEANTEDDQINKRAAMDGWIFLDVRDLKNITEVNYGKQ